MSILSPPEINVKDPTYGAKGDGVTDDTAAITAAAAALPASGGALLFPPGDYPHTGLSFDGTRSVRVVGMGGLSAGGSTASRLTYTGTGARAISARSTYGFGVADVCLAYASAQFTGYGLDLSHGGDATDSAYWSLERCLIGGLGVTTANGLNLDQAIVGEADKCVFLNHQAAVVGRAAAGNYSNAHQFNSCAFNQSVVAHVRNPGESWAFSNCTAEPLVDGSAGWIVVEAGYVSKGLTIVAPWAGDANGGTWIDFRGNGLTVVGGLLGDSLNGIMLETGLVTGATILGVCFSNTVNGINQSACPALTVLGCTWYNVPNEITGAIGAGAFGQHSGSDLNVGGPFKALGTIGFYGHAPVAQPAAPVTLADVIAVIRGCGLSA